MSEIKALEKLREFAKQPDGGFWLDEFNKIADEIEDEYTAVDVSGYPRLFDTPEAMHMILGTAADNFNTPEDAVFYLRGDTSTALPVDADGVPIHVGDEIIIPIGEKRTVQFIAPNAVLPTSTITFWRADGCTHYHAPTVEDVLYTYGQSCIRAHEEAESDDAKREMLASLRKEFEMKLREVMRDE